jgi:hypothetical protein
MIIYLSTWLAEKQQGVVLTKKRYSHRLLSFHFLKEQGVTTALFRKYIQRGIVSLKKKKDDN